MALEVHAQSRKLQGTGASRRLRNGGKVPGIVYGGKKPAINIELDHNALYHALRNEKFHASILELTLDGAKEQVLLRAVNMHPFKVQVQHVDFQRVTADQKIHMKVPLHFVGADVSPAVKLSSALVSHAMNELDVRCLPADLPEFIEVDLSKITVGHSVHVLDLTLPKGVEAVLRLKENPAVATAQIPRAAIAEEEAAAAAAAEASTKAADVPAVKQKAPEAAAGDKKEDKKDDKKDDKGGKK
ncbi:MAG: 50S ribosomal protein L25/general stress protein Ctc [Betaproteobacteria bacterium]|nr:50S ribosomal protein L25/general stress protein Ctc [Betaproteobacteria bacterium]